MFTIGGGTAQGQRNGIASALLGRKVSQRLTMQAPATGTGE